MYQLITNRDLIATDDKNLILPGVYTVDPNTAPTWVPAGRYGRLISFAWGNNPYIGRPMLFISSDNELFFQWTNVNQSSYGWLKVATI